MFQMLRLQVNHFVDVCDYDDAKAHRVIAFKMDILDTVNVLSPHLMMLLASRNEAMHEMETDSDGD